MPDPAKQPESNCLRIRPRNWIVRADGGTWQLGFAGGSAYILP